MKSKLLDINPLATIITYEHNILEDAILYFSLIEQQDIVIGATDDIRVQGRISRICYSKKKPAIFVGVFEGAVGGEVVIVDPIRSSPCYCCTTHRVPVTTAYKIEDYGSERASGVSALSCDIMNVVTVAAKIALGILALNFECKESTLWRFGKDVVENQCYYTLITQYVDYWKEKVLPYVGYEDEKRPLGEYALGCYWIEIDCDNCRNDCDVCGASPIPLENYPWVPLSSYQLAQVIDPKPSNKSKSVFVLDQDNLTFTNIPKSEKKS